MHKIKFLKMTLNAVFQFLVPKDKTFFPLFEKASANLIQLAACLHEYVNVSSSEREKLFHTIEELKQNAELLTHQTNMELNRNFITPFDREDIYSLTSAMENVAGNLHGTASRMKLYQVEEITKSIRKLTEINLEACQEIAIAIKEMKGFKNIDNIITSCAKINKLESKSDMVYDKAVSDIFENEKDVKRIIIYKEVLSALETATDKCKSVASVLESISVKHS